MVCYYGWYAAPSAPVTYRVYPGFYFDHSVKVATVAAPCHYWWF